MQSKSNFNSPLANQKFLRFLSLSLLSLLLLSIGCEQAPRTGQLLNTQAPDFVIEKWISEEPDLTGKFILIDFWATWCGPCLIGIPELNSLHKNLEEQITIIGVSSEDEEAVKKFSKKNIDYFVAIDKERRLERALGIHYIPYVVIIDPEGTIRWEGNPRKKGSELSEELISQIIDENSKSTIFRTFENNPPLHKTQNNNNPPSSSKRQAIIEFFIYILCETNILDEQKMNLPIQSQIIEKDFSKFGISQKDMQEFMSGNPMIFLGHQELIADKAIKKCTNYSKEQIDQFLFYIKASYENSPSQNGIEELSDESENSPMSWFMKAGIILFTIFFILVLIEATTDILPDFGVMIPWILLSAALFIGCNLLQSFTQNKSFGYMMPLGVLPLFGIFLHKKIEMWRKRRFGKTSNPDEWICRECGETNHKISRVCVSCQSKKPD